MMGMWMQITFSIYWDLEHMHASELKYFTEWGKYMTCFTCTLLVMGHIWFKPADPQSIELGLMWKLCSWFFTMTLWWDIIISFVFWSFLLPTTNFGEVFFGHPWGEFKLMTDHIFPLFFLSIDWMLNGITYEKTQIWPNLIPTTIYAFVNLTVVKVSGQPVYPGMTWDSFLSVLLVLIAFPCGIGLWFLLCWCTNKKITKILSKSDFENEEYTNTLV